MRLKSCLEPRCTRCWPSIHEMSRTSSMRWRPSRQTQPVQMRNCQRAPACAVGLILAGLESTHRLNCSGRESPAPTLVGGLVLEPLFLGSSNFTSERLSFLQNVGCRDITKPRYRLSSDPETWQSSSTKSSIMIRSTKRSRRQKLGQPNHTLPPRHVTSRICPQAKQAKDAKTAKMVRNAAIR